MSSGHIVPSAIRSCRRSTFWERLPCSSCSSPTRRPRRGRGSSSFSPACLLICFGRSGLSPRFGTAFARLLRHLCVGLPDLVEVVFFQLLEIEHFVLGVANRADDLV